MRQDQGPSMCVLQAHRITQFDGVGLRDPDTVGNIVQFLSLLMAFEGVEAISAEDKKALVPKFRLWMREYPGRTASNASERCYGMLTGDECVWAWEWLTRR